MPTCCRASVATRLWPYANATLWTIPARASERDQPGTGSPGRARTRTRNGAPRAGTRTGSAEPRARAPGRTGPWTRTKRWADPRTRPPGRAKPWTRTPTDQEEIRLPRDVGLRHGGRGRRRTREPGDTEQSEGGGNCQGFHSHQRLVNEPHLTESGLRNQRGRESAR